MNNSSPEFEQFKKGSTEAFEKLFSRYHVTLFYYILKMCPDPMTAGPIVAEAFQIVWERRDHIEDEDHFIAYLYITVRCKYLSLLRSDNTRKKAEREFANTVDTSHNNIYESAEERERIKLNASAMLRQAIKKLPRQRRTVIYKLFFEGKTTSQIAREMGLAAQTVLNHKAKALDFLRKELTGMEFLVVLAGLLLIRYGG